MIEERIRKGRRNLTCIIIQKDQQKQQMKRNRQPSSKFSPPVLNSDFDDKSSVFSSFGPLTSAMQIAPPTEKSVPIILAILLKLCTLIFSNLQPKKKKRKEMKFLFT